jgi:outer membrane receptor protein involved in Fe transport
MESNTGDRRVADVNLFDVRVQKEFALTGSARFDVFLDALNLTNSDQYESVGSSLGTATAAFGVPTRYTPPRRMQLGAKIRW